MIRFAVLTAAAVALTATAAVAEPYYAGEYNARGSVSNSLSEPTNYQFQPGGASTAPGFGAQNDTQALDWTVNTGAGTSQSHTANQG